jgi:hypothetical protein
MEIEEIEITIGKNGQVKLHVRGMKGKKCLTLTEELEKALGNEILDRKFTPEALDNSAGNKIDQSLDVKS